MSHNRMHSSHRRVSRRVTGLFAALTLLALTLFGCASKPAPEAAAPAKPEAQGTYGVLLMAHGGTPEWNAAVLDAVSPLRERHAIEVAFGMADAASLQDAIKKLEARGVRRIGVVRLFISGESFTSETEQILGLRPGAPDASKAGTVMHPIMAAFAGPHGSPAAAADHAAHAAPADHAAHGAHADHAAHAAHAGHGAGGHGGHSMEFFRVATQSSFALSKDGLVDATGMGAVLADRASALSKTPATEDVLILAHGPGDDAENARWMTKLDERAAAVRARAPFRRVQVETLREDWPEKRVEAEKRIRAYVERATAEGGTAIVLPFRVQGFGPYKEVLKDLTFASDGKGLLPHEQITRWIEAEMNKLAAGPFEAPTAR